MRENLQKEIDFLKCYLPETISFDVLLEKVFDLGKNENIPQSPQSKWVMMKACIAAFSSQADNKDISKAVDAYLDGE